jgi:hypothetical protein
MIVPAAIHPYALYNEVHYIGPCKCDYDEVIYMEQQTGMLQW